MLYDSYVRSPLLPDIGVIGVSKPRQGSYLFID